MAAVVGVHGIMNEHSGRHQLLATWAPSLADGIERSVGRQVIVPGLDIAFYGDFFLKAGSASTSKGAHDSELPKELVGLSYEEIRFLVESVDETAGRETDAEGDRTKMLAGPREWGARLLGRMDKVFGSRSAAVLYLGALRQVHGYLRTPALKAAIDARLEAVIGAGCRVLVAHSLGSVVALEFIRQHPQQRVDLFLTIGSPLGLRLVQGLLPQQAQTLDYMPENVGRWVNAWDRSDPVSCGGSLCGRWRGVADDPSIDNGSSPHSASRYLSKRQVGEAIVSAMPELLDLGTVSGS